MNKPIDGASIGMNLKELLPESALAFRGYNVTNLGRTHDLLMHKDYGPVVSDFLSQGSAVCAEVVQRPVDLVSRVERQEEPSLEEYAESIALIVAMEQAQLELLSRFHDADYRTAQVSVGFSLGEISALVAGGVYTMRDALQIPLHMSADCVKLAHDTKMGVVFSRGEEIPRDRVRGLCQELNRAGSGVIGVSTYISPNSFLVLGSGDTLQRFRSRLKELTPRRLTMRPNEHRWPPLHTPLVWQYNVPNRASVMLHTLPGGDSVPVPDILSMVTGQRSYDALNSRELIAQWIDHPQMLWEVVNELLVSGVETLIHIGPQPNIIPATFERLATNVEAQTKASRRMRAASVVARRRWLQALLPKRAALLRAPLVRHVVLEDWLMDPHGEAVGGDA